MLGLSLSVASTVVLLKALEERNAVQTPNGRIAIGWLVVEDLAMILALVLLPVFAETFGGHLGGGLHAPQERGVLTVLAITFAKVGAFIAILLVVGPRVLPWMLRQVARTGSRELFTLCVLAVALGIAFASAELFGVSFALGAFFAGMILHESDLSHKAATNSLPLQDAFAVLFFLSVGMLFDPSVILREPLMVAGVILLILVGKSLVALGIVLVLGYPLSTALTVSASLAQIGEFSFILAGLGYQLWTDGARRVELDPGRGPSLYHVKSSRVCGGGQDDSMGARQTTTEPPFRGLVQRPLRPLERRFGKRTAARGGKGRRQQDFHP